MKTGDEFTVTVDASAEQALRASTFDVAYDPARFRALRVEPGGMVKPGKEGAFRHDIQVAEGRVSVSYSAPADIKGDGTRGSSCRRSARTRGRRSYAWRRRPSRITPASSSRRLRRPR